MPTFRLTKKVLKTLGLPITVDQTADSPDSILGDWYANEFRLFRHKCFMLTSEKTRFSFLVPEAGKGIDLERNLRDQLGRYMLDQGYGGALIGRVVDQHRNMGFGLTANRSILSVMNQRIQDIKVIASYQWDSWEEVDWRQLFEAINKSPFQLEKRCTNAFDELAHALESASRT